MKMNEFKILQPTKCREEEIKSFYELELKADQVSKKNLYENIKCCHRLGFCYSDSKLIAIGALKNPNSSYKMRIFKSAKCIHSNKYKYELGYLYTAPSSQGEGISSELVKLILESEPNSTIFATTRTDNEQMQHILSKNNFFICGESFKSSKGEYNLVLFIKY